MQFIWHRSVFTQRTREMPEHGIVARIASISNRAQASTIDLGNGNTQPYSGGFTWASGQSGSSGSASFSGSLLLASNNFFRTFTDDPVLSEQALELPQMSGSGWVRDLREAMSLGTAESAGLADAVAAFSAAGTRDEQQALLHARMRTSGCTECSDQPGAAI